MRRFNQAALLITSCNLGVVSAITPQASITNLNAKLAKLEQSYHGQLGVALVDIVSGQVASYRGEQRFPLCSTAKVMVVSHYLKLSESRPLMLEQKFKINQSMLTQSGYAPICRKLPETAASFTQLGQAAIEYSDNAAMNILLAATGGPAATTAFARTLGDKSFRLDRNEPSLNSALPSDPQDTATPLGMASNLQKLLFESGLAPTQRQLLQTWLQHNTTGNKRIRAGVPANWLVGDKTGSGAYGTTNDLAVIWRPQAGPLILSLYFTTTESATASNDQVLAEATKLIIKELRLAKKTIN